MNKIKNKLSKINFIANTALKAIDLYKNLKLKSIDFKYEQAVYPSITKTELIAYNKSRKFTVNKNICFAPKKSMMFSFDGNVYLCCDNKEASIGNITTQNLHDIWFGEKRYLLDKQINQDYNLEKGCITCEYKIKNKNYSTVQAQNFDLYTTNNSEYPARLEFEIHNTCNLECIMCDGAHSSSIHANRNKLPALKMVYDDIFTKQLIEFIPYLKSINLLGGEPTLIKTYYDIIEKVTTINPSCFIHLQTNASNISEKFKSLLEKGNFEIGISIDALTKELAIEIRKNIDFEKHIETIQYYISLHKQNKIKVTVNTCILTNNWKEIIPIIQFCNEHKLTIFICVITNPFYNSFLSTTIEFVEHVSTELKHLMKELPQSNYFEKNNYVQLSDFLNMLESWKVSISALTQYRVLNINKSTEELYKLLRENLISFFYNNEQHKLINETILYVELKLNLLNESGKKELLIIIINMLKDQTLMTPEAEYTKWANEYISNLVFSFKSKKSINEYS